jgi:hypothetical protein
MRGVARLPASRTARVLWVSVAVVAVALAAATAVTTLRAGNDEPSESAQYLRAINRELVTTGSLAAQANRSYRRFREDPASVDVGQLEEVERSLRDVRRRVAAVPAPAVATDLRRAVLGALDAQADLAGEVALLAAYLPVTARVATDLREATARLRRDVNTASLGPAQSAAFDAYARRTEALAERVRAAEPPKSFTRAREAEADRLEELASSAASVAEGLRTGRPTRINRSLDRFAAAATSSRVAVERREAALVYGRRIREITRLQILVDRERRELEAAGA